MDYEYIWLRLEVIKKNQWDRSHRCDSKLTRREDLIIIGVDYSQLARRDVAAIDSAAVHLSFTIRSHREDYKK